jgi:hypothetical protein
MLIDIVRAVYASKTFTIKDDFEVISFEDISAESIVNESKVPENLEMFASVKIAYDGELPDSYKILNIMIGDWVVKKEKELTKVIHEKLAKHFEENYPGSDYSELNDAESEDSAIWTDQLDYMPRSGGEKFLIIEVELVLDSEPIYEDD